MKLLVLNNLESGYRDGAIFDFIRALQQANDEVVIRAIDHNSDFSHAVRDARQFDAVIASGGDGTVASVCYLLSKTGVPILPFPAGTANLIVSNLASPTEPTALANQVRNLQTLDFDMGEIEFGDEKRGFMMMAGCGYDALIMEDARAMKKKIGPFAYFTSALIHPNPQVSDITLTIDGETVQTKGVGVLLVNFSEIQFDISFTRENLPRDGMLDVLVLATHNAWGLIPSILGAAIDKNGLMRAHRDAIRYFRGREITVDAQPSLTIQADGDAIRQHTPFTARVLPGATKLIVSDAGKGRFEA